MQSTHSNRGEYKEMQSTHNNRGEYKEMQSTHSNRGERDAKYTQLVTLCFLWFTLL